MDQKLPSEGGGEDSDSDMETVYASEVVQIVFTVVVGEWRGEGRGLRVASCV